MTRPFELYERVRVLGGRFEAEGVPAGTLGYIIEHHSGEALEIEVSNPATGETIATIVATPEELEHAPERPT